MSRFEIVKDEFRKNGGLVPLPIRATKTSAGYDFYATQDLVIQPQCEIKFFTDVKIKLEEDTFLLCVVRSSKGIKDSLMLSNTIGVIDSDYYNNPDNDGNIGIFLRNLRPEMKLCGYNIIGDSDIRIPIIQDLRQANTVYIPKGERIVQGIIVKYEKATNCNKDEDRKGGIGSTDK